MIPKPAHNIPGIDRYLAQRFAEGRVYRKDLLQVFIIGEEGANAFLAKCMTLKEGKNLLGGVQVHESEKGMRIYNCCGGECSIKNI